VPSLEGLFPIHVYVFSVSRRSD